MKTTMSDNPETLQQAVVFFSDPDRCDEYMRKIRWQESVPRCIHCESNKLTWMTTRRKYQCNACRKQFSMTVGTVFESSHVTLDKWFLAVWLIANCKNGISSYELARDVGVTQKTGWFMLHRIRAAMDLGSADKLDGPVEADTSYVGGKAANMHKERRERTITGRGASGKTAIHGILQRTDDRLPSFVRAEVIATEDAERLLPAVRRNVRHGAKVFTDSARAYSELCLTHLHSAIDHGVAYAMGAVHTNGLENFWSLLKRTIGGTYVAVAPFHLTRYVDEQAFRFNTRTGNDAGRLDAAMSGINGKRLTYRQLTGKDDAGFMGIV